MSNRFVGFTALCAVLALLAAKPAIGSDTEALPSASELKKMSLEELMDVQVTLVSKRPESLNEVPSAIQVITGEDIRRSGAATLAEAMRLAPNLQVAQLDGRQWAISARGFNNPLANKLLVMIDGRTVYTPLYAGVFWDVQHMPLENVERIEVVSGPGGTLWGANAVNGVINIVTKSAQVTTGGLVVAEAGTFLRDQGVLRYGGEAAPGFFYRVSGQRLDHNSSESIAGGGGESGWDFTQGGFRMDWTGGGKDTFMSTGSLYGGSNGARLPGDSTVSGGFLLGKWTRSLSSRSGFHVQMYFDRTERYIPGNFEQDLYTYDLDFNHRFSLGARNSLMWGAGYRLQEDYVENSLSLAFLPGRKDLNLFNFFVQDQVDLLESLRLTAGTKIEHNDYSGFEVMPSARLAWVPVAEHVLWGAVSRAVRSPSRFDAELFLPGPPVPEGFSRIEGGPDFGAEILNAYELGYRARFRENLSLSASVFYHWYDGLRIYEIISPEPMVIEMSNGAVGETRGLELSADIRPVPWWRLKGGYAFLLSESWLKPDRFELPIPPGQGDDPRHRFVVLSWMDLPWNFQFNGVARYAGRLEGNDVPDYFTFDLGAAWVFGGWDLSVHGKSLAEESHPEYGPAANRQEIPRSLSARAAWRF